MSRNMPIATAVELPNQGIAPTHEPHGGHHASDAMSEKHVEAGDEIPSDLVMHEEAMPEGPTTSRWEEWAYYLYYNGDSGVGPGSYAQTLSQNYLTQATHDKITGAKPCTNPNADLCVLQFAGQERSVASVALIANGITFAVMTFLFTTIGSIADYENWNKYILLIATVICWGVQFGFLGTKDGNDWQTGIALYIVGYIAYGVTLVFYASVFPRLARNTQKAKDARLRLDNSEISPEEYEMVEMLERNRISNISTAHSDWGYLITLALNLAILLPLANNPMVDQYTLAFTNCYWIVLGLPWFFVQKNRRGPAFPKDSHWWSIGWKQVYLALKQYKRLPYTFIYLFAFFLLADSLNTTGSVVGIVQNQHIQFSFLQSTYLGLSQAATSTFSCYAYWYFQRYFKIKTKVMFEVCVVVTVFLSFWGMLGIWTNKIGYHNTWEFWFYNVVFGLGQAPYYAYAQTMMAELTPPGFEGMFFGLFGITNRVSSLIGPNVCAAIIDRTNNSWDAFAFLFALSAAAALVIFVFVDMEKGRAQAIAFSIEERGSVEGVREEQATHIVSGLKH
ncbi:autophagy-related protein 22-like protein [Kockovaella imperatae]|uniref:Autophagy-related protein n=1 Tax=Kockovaella imperatae TaxID=4999 RepID=A0A1Y1UBQ1_9TREE|nr:autophagy-related protein 22-like protein [Kockovaella imperatae]ORX35478.1 autophagy-related protein 22-like protein [Kockovaella imperatae]